jgi:hypothetical protein
MLPAMARKTIQWHPLFIHLLRPRVEGYYEVRTGVPVGDLPREADLVLLRRIGAGRPPFQSLWRRLTTWNLLEFKGPTEDARPAHLPLLIELGLGIAHRLNEEQDRAGSRLVPEGQIAFWYLANRLGRRFQAEAGRLLGAVEEVAAGLWRTVVVGHPVHMVSTVDLAVDDDSLPLHVLALEPIAQERQVGQYVAARPERVEAYAGTFSLLHQAVWEEVVAMAGRKRRTLTLDFRPAIKSVGLAELIRQAGKENVVREIGAKDVVKELGVEAIWAHLSPAQRRELKRRLAEEAAQS